MVVAHWIEQAIDGFFALGLFVNAVLFLPQIIRLIKNKNSEELSTVMFVGFAIIQMLAILNALIHNDPALLYGSIISCIACSTTAFLVIYYRIKPGKPTPNEP